MKEILDGVYELQLPRPAFPERLVVSRDEPISSHVRTGNGTTLLGTGYALSTETLLAELESVGGVDHVIVEHADSDHFGAVPGLRDRYPEAALAIPAEGVVSLRRVYADVRVDTELHDGDDIAGLRAIKVPGHTEGNMSFLDAGNRVLYVGDTFVGSDSDVAKDGDWSGAFAPPAAAFNADDAAALANLPRLAGYDFDAALLTHGENVYSGAKAAFERLLDDVAEL